MRRNWSVLFVVAVCLATILTFGLVPAVTTLYAARHRFAGAIDPWIIDIGSLVANAALLVALFRLRRRSQSLPIGEEDAA